MAKRAGKSRAPGFDELRNTDLKTGEFRPVYVIDGVDQLRIGQVVNSLRKKALDPASAAFNEHLLDGDQVGWDSVLQQAQGFPMLGGRQVVLVRHADHIKADRDGETALRNYLASPVESTLLIITGSKFDGRRTWLAAAKKAGVYFHFEAPKGQALERWVQTASKKAGLDLDQAGREALIHLVGSDLQGMLVEIEKLALLQESRGCRLTAEDIPELVMDQAQLEVFRLTDTIGPGQGAELMRSWLRLTTWGSDVYQLTPLVMTHLRRTALAASYLEAGAAPGEIAGITGLNAWMLNKGILPLAGRLGARSCRTILNACLACERAQKSRPVPADLAFEQLLLDVTRVD